MMQEVLVMSQLPVVLFQVPPQLLQSVEPIWQVLFDEFQVNPVVAQSAAVSISVAIPPGNRAQSISQ
jgi:hypothetical protein